MTLFFFSYPPHTQVSAHINEPERISARDPQSLTQLSKRQPRGEGQPEKGKDDDDDFIEWKDEKNGGNSRCLRNVNDIYTKSIQAHPSSLCISAVWLAPARPFVVKNIKPKTTKFGNFYYFFSLLKKKGEIVNQLINSALEEEEKKRRKK
jgi:hypothetical protein